MPINYDKYRKLLKPYKQRQNDDKYICKLHSFKDEGKVNFSILLRENVVQVLQKVTHVVE